MVSSKPQLCAMPHFNQQITSALRDIENQFSTLFHTQLNALFDATDEVAVIGGAVRDAVLIRLVYGRQTFFRYRDLDVAALTRNTYNRIRESGNTLHANRYGGLKVKLAPHAVVDIWHWERPSISSVGKHDWERWLERVDFGINAIAFLWPSKTIVSHSSWEQCLRSGEVSPLTKKPISRHRDALRAFGLQCRIGLLRPYSVTLRVVSELDWLLTQGSESERLDAFSYYVSSTGEGRFPGESVEVLRRVVVQEIGLNQLPNLEELLALSEQTRGQQKTGQPSLVSLVKATI